MRLAVNDASPLGDAWKASLEDQVTNRIDERRAAALLGLSLPDLQWFSRFAGVGQPQGSGEQKFFTYEELTRLSALAAASSK
jgi:hypothetical protein